MDITMDIWELFTHPEWYPFIFAVLAAYVLLSLFAGKSSLWDDRSTFEKILMAGALGFALYFGMSFPLVWLYSIWAGLSDRQIFESSGYLLLAFGAFIPLALRALGKSGAWIFRIFIYVPILLMLGSGLELIIAWIINVQVHTYPSYLSNVMVPFWDSVYSVSVVCALFVFCFNYLIFFLFVGHLINEVYRRILTVEPEQRSGIKGWRHRIFLLKPSIRRKHKIILVLLGMIILVPSIIIPIDQSYPFLTPRLYMDREKDYLAPRKKRELILSRFETWKGTEYKYYGLVYKEFNATIPNLSLTNSFYVESPSNLTEELVLDNPPYHSRWEHINNIWLSCTQNISATSQTNKGVIEGIILNFENITEKTLAFNLTYYKLLQNVNVTIVEDQMLGEYYNETRQECYYFYIYNGENVTLTIHYFEFSRLIYEGVDSETVRVFRNGQEFPWAVVDSYYIRPDVLIPAYGTVNLTISLQFHRH